MFIKSENKNKITNKPYLLCVNETRKCTIDINVLGNGKDAAIIWIRWKAVSTKWQAHPRRKSCKCAMCVCECVACPEFLNCKSIAMGWLTVLIIIRGSCMANLQRTMRLIEAISKAYKWLNPTESVWSEDSSSEKKILFFVKININYRKQYVFSRFFSAVRCTCTKYVLWGHNSFVIKSTAHRNRKVTIERMMAVM